MSAHTATQALTVSFVAQLRALADHLSEPEWESLAATIRSTIGGGGLDIGLFPIVTEGCVDRFCGRPREKNPYDRTSARNHYEAWEWGWDDANSLLEQRGRDEAARWLREAA
jgi:hypothetical protein